MTSNASLIGAAMLLVVLLAGHGYLTLTGYSATPVIQVGDPASANFVSLGGSHEVRRDSDGGESGYCIFVDGRACEEWALFQRAECVSPR